MSANSLRGERDRIFRGHMLALSAMLLVFCADLALAAEPTSPWLYLSIAPDQVVNARSAEPDASPDLALSNLIGQLPRAPDQVAPEAGASHHELIAQSVACLAVGGLASAATLMVGWQNVTNLISGGGSVPGATPSVVALGVFGVVFTSFCAIGQALTPLYLHYFPEPPAPAPNSQPPPASDPGCSNCGPSAVLPHTSKTPAGAARELGTQALRVSTTACGASVAPRMLLLDAC